MDENERRQDDDYIRVVDALARFYNAQNTSHSGYLLTIVVIYLAFSSLVVGSFDIMNRFFIHYVGLPAFLWPIISFDALLFGFMGACLLITWVLGRLEYYVALSEAAIDHLPYSAGGEKMERFYRGLRSRAIGPEEESVFPLGVRDAIMRLFQARLYVSLMSEKSDKKYELNPDEKKTFHLTNDSVGDLGECYWKRKVLRIWRLTSLLLSAHRNMLKSYKGKGDEAGKIWNRFEQFVDR